jgi:predicted nucleic acid-binding protein
VDAVELLGGEAPFIADTSAWWRFWSLPGELAGLLKTAMDDDRLWITPIVRMEILYSARSTSEYIALETELDGFRILRNDRAVADAAMSAITLLDWTTRSRRVIRGVADEDLGSRCRHDRTISTPDLPNVLTGVRLSLSADQGRSAFGPGMPPSRPKPPGIPRKPTVSPGLVIS